MGDELVDKHVCKVSVFTVHKSRFYLTLLGLFSFNISKTSEV